MPRALSLIIPEGLIVIAAVVLARFGTSIPGFAQVAEWAPGLVFLAGAGLAWRYGRGRLIAGLLIVAGMWGWVVTGQTREFIPVLALALSFVLLVVGWSKERGLRGWYMPALILSIIVIAGLLAFIATAAYPGHFVVQNVGPLAWTGLEPWAGGPLVVATFGLLIASVVRADGVTQGALWAVVAGWGALVFEDRPGALIMVAGGMAALVTGTLESIYSAAYRDALTGLPSRRALDERLDALPPGVVVAMVDVDHFKQFNDTHGHDTGDQVLRMVAWRLAEVPDAEAFRYGGEEFTLLFAGDPVAEALTRLEGARHAVAMSKFMLRSSDRPKGKQGKSARGRDAVRHGLSVTISIGAAVRKDGEHPAALLKRADDALYAAKEAGRDRVVTAR